MSNYDMPEGFNGYIICPSSHGLWNTETAANNINEILTQFSENHNIDKDNIVIVGHSMGGDGALYLPNSPVFNQEDGFKFKKAAVLTGYPNSEQKYNIPVGLWVDSGSKWALDEYVAPYLDFDGKDKYVNMCYYEHGMVDNETFKLDTNGNGRADIFEWLFDY